MPLDSAPVQQEQDRRGNALAGGAPKRPRLSDPSDVFVLDFDGVIVNSEPEARLVCGRTTLLPAIHWEQAQRVNRDSSDPGGA